MDGRKRSRFAVFGLLLVLTNLLPLDIIIPGIIDSVRASGEVTQEFSLDFGTETNAEFYSNNQLLYPFLNVPSLPGKKIKSVEYSDYNGTKSVPSAVGNAAWSGRVPTTGREVIVTSIGNAEIDTYFAWYRYSNTSPQKGWFAKEDENGTIHDLYCENGETESIGGVPMPLYPTCSAEVVFPAQRDKSFVDSSDKWIEDSVVHITGFSKPSVMEDKSVQGPEGTSGNSEGTRTTNSISNPTLIQLDTNDNNNFKIKYSQSFVGYPSDDTPPPSPAIKNLAAPGARLMVYFGSFSFDIYGKTYIHPSKATVTYEDDGTAGGNSISISGAGEVCTHATLQLITTLTQNGSSQSFQSNPKLTWTSSNPSYATVSNSGLVTTTGTTGGVTITAHYVDSSQSIDVSGTAIVTVKNCNGEPDLIPTGLSIGDCFESGDTPVFQYKVRNVGTTTNQTFRVSLKHDETEIAFQIIDGLSANQERSFTYSGYTFGSAAMQSFSVVVDSANNVDESDEGNALSEIFTPSASCGGGGGETVTVTGDFNFDRGTSITWGSAQEVVPIGIEVTGACNYVSHKFRFRQGADTGLTTDELSPKDTSYVLTYDPGRFVYEGDIGSGSVTVWMDIETDCGQFGTAGPKTFTINPDPSNRPPNLEIAWFQTSTGTETEKVVQNTSVYLKVTHKDDPDGNPITISWDFSYNSWTSGLPAAYRWSIPYNKNQYTGINANMTGSHKVCATAKDTFRSNSEPACATLEVTGPEPIPVITGSTITKVNRSLVPELSSEESYSPVVGRTIDHSQDEWTNKAVWNDGTTSQWSGKTNVFPKDGIVQVELHVYDDIGLKSVIPAMHTVTVVPDEKPVPVLLHTPVASRIGSSQFRNDSYSNDGDPIEEYQVWYGYDAANNGSCNPYEILISSTTSPFNFEPAKVGKYCFRVYVKETTGLDAYKDYLVDVVNEGPDVQFTIKGTAYEPALVESYAITPSELLSGEWTSSTLDYPEYNKFWSKDTSENSLMSNDIYTFAAGGSHSEGSGFRPKYGNRISNISNNNLTKSLYIIQDPTNALNDTDTDTNNAYMGDGIWRYYTDKDFSSDSGHKGGNDYVFHRNGIELFRMPVVTFGDRDHYEEECGLSYRGNRIGIIDVDTKSLYSSTTGRMNIYDLDAYRNGRKVLVETVTWTKPRNSHFGCSKVPELYMKLGSDPMVYPDFITRENPDTSRVARVHDIKIVESEWWDYCDPNDSESSQCEFHSYEVAKSNPDGSVAWSKPLFSAQGEPFFSAGLTYNIEGTYVRVDYGSLSRTFRVLDGAETGYTFSASSQDDPLKRYNDHGYIGSVDKNGTVMRQNGKALEIRDGFTNELVDTIDFSDKFPAGFESVSPGLEYISDSKIAIHIAQEATSGPHKWDYIARGMIVLESDPPEPKTYKEYLSAGQLIKPTMDPIANSTIHYTMKFNYIDLDDYVDKSPAGFSFRVVDHKNMYRLESGIQYTSLYKVVDSTKTLLQRAYVPMAASEYKSFSIMTQDSNIKVKVGGITVIDLNDSTFSSGRFGPFAQRNFVEFKGMSYQVNQAKVATKIDGIALVNQPVEYEKTYADVENDPVFEAGTEWSYTHTDTGMFLDFGDGWSGLSSKHGTVVQNPYLTFDKVGQYTIKYRVPDDPHPSHRRSLGDSSFAGYSKYSDYHVKNLIVHRAPISNFTLSLQANDTVAWTDYSFDPDRCYTHGNCQTAYAANNGIYGKKFYYITPGGAVVNAKLTSPTEIGAYSVGMAVQDEYGTWSEWYVVMINILQPPPPNNPPGVTLTLPNGSKANPSPVSQQPTITWDQFDPDPGTIFSLFNLTVKDEWGNCVECVSNRSMETPNTSWAWTMDNVLLQGQKYQVQVQASDGEAWSGWSSIGWMSTNSPPTVYMTFPWGTEEAPTVVSMLRPTLTWFQSDPDQGASFQYYRLQITSEDNTAILYDSCDNPSCQQWQGTTSTSGIHAVTANLPAGQKLRVRVKVWDEQGAESDWSPQAWMIVNRPPEADFMYSPSIIYEGDTITITNISTDRDGNSLAYQWEVVNPKGELWTYSSEHPEPFTQTLAGSYTVKLTVTDIWGLTSSLTKSITVQPLGITGIVQHTPDWERNRRESNLSQGNDPESPWTSEQFLAGEKFMLAAETTTIHSDSSVRPLEVKVTFDRTLDETMLDQHSMLHQWSGQLWEEEYVNLAPGPAAFTFQVIYSNGTVKTSVVPITIMNRKADDYWSLKRDK